MKDFFFQDGGRKFVLRAIFFIYLAKNIWPKIDPKFRKINIDSIFLNIPIPAQSTVHGKLVTFF